MFIFLGYFKCYCIRSANKSYLLTVIWPGLMSMPFLCLVTKHDVPSFNMHRNSLHWFNTLFSIIWGWLTLSTPDTEYFTSTSPSGCFIYSNIAMHIMFSLYGKDQFRDCLRYWRNSYRFGMTCRWINIY